MTDMPEFTKENYPETSRVRIASKTEPDKYNHDVTIKEWVAHLPGMVDVIFNEACVPGFSRRINAEACEVIHRITPRGNIEAPTESEKEFQQPNPIDHPVGTKLKVLAIALNETFEVEVKRWDMDAWCRSQNEVRLLFKESGNDTWVPSRAYKVLEVLESNESDWIGKERMANQSAVPDDRAKEHIDDCVRFFEIITEAKAIGKKLGFLIDVRMK